MIDLLKHLMHDHQFHLGTFGATLSISGKWIYDNVSPILGLLAAIGGLIIVVYSIIEKSKKNKLLDAELRLRQEELKKLRNQ